MSLESPWPEKFALGPPEWIFSLIAHFEGGDSKSKEAGKWWQKPFNDTNRSKGTGTMVNGCDGRALAHERRTCYARRVSLKESCRVLA